MRKSILVLVLGGVAVIAPSVSNAADTVPAFNIAANCKAEVAENSGIGETLDSCIRDEQAAKTELAQQWAQFSRADKTSCIKETSVDGTPSYVELETCLEMTIGSKPGSEDRK